jgi:hypothetical protein
MHVDSSKWSGEGAFTQVMIDQLTHVPQIADIRVEDAPASRSEADYNFVSNEIFVTFRTVARTEPTRRWRFFPGSRTVYEKALTMAQFENVLTSMVEVGPPDYSDDGMIQYLRTERIIPPYQTKGFKIVELVRIYEAAAERI